MIAPLPWWPIAQAELGVAEVAGPGDNVRIREYLASTAVGVDLAREDETPWCSAFANWCVEKAGVTGTRSAWARSWLSWGREARWDELVQGAVVVLSRDGGGHVGFLQAVEWDLYGVWGSPAIRVHLLGGNQDDRVKISAYPASRVLTIRVP